MADGIHVFNLPERATEKQLKVYFSNPRNGGGHIRKILHPLPHNSAIVLFDNSRTVRDILQKHHVLREQRLSVHPLPKKIFGAIKVELEKGVSQYIERNPSVVDELQYVGEIAVDFHYEKEIYILKGNWYQLEWALHYLDTLLDESDVEPGDKAKTREKEWRNMRKEYEEIDEEFDVPEPKKHEIKKPNIPITSKAQGGTTRNYGLTGKTNAVERKKDVDRSSKNASRTVTQNLEVGRESKVDNDFKSYRREDRNSPRYREDDSGSDNENYGNYYTTMDFMDQYGSAYDTEKAVTFSNDTDFSETKPRPARMAPKRTKGIDVAHTDFGEVPLIHEFMMPNDLKVKVLMDDISKQSTDGIVNPTSPDLMSMFGASRAIVQAGGIQMQREMKDFVKKNGNLGWAEVCHTKPGGTLNKNVVSVLHTASPGWNEEKSEEATHYLVCTYINCLTYADSKLWLQTIATPVISSGNYGFPLDVCIQAFYDALLLFSTNGQLNTHLKEVHLVCFDEDTSMAAIVLLQSLFDCDTNQALSAAADRYNTRFLKSNFAAENFSTDEVVATNDSKREDGKETKPRKQQINKNAMRNVKMEQGEEEGSARLNRAESDVTKQDGGRFTNLDLFKDSGRKEKGRDKEMFKYNPPTYAKDVKSDSSDENEEMKNVPESQLRKSEFVDREGKKSVRSDRKTSSSVFDAKKSVQNIERPKFHGEDEDHGDVGEFSVGIIGADEYFKKFEDLIVIEDMVEDEDGEQFGVKKEKGDDGLHVDEKTFERTEKKNEKEVMNDKRDKVEERSTGDNEERLILERKVGNSEKSEKKMVKNDERDVQDSDDEVQTGIKPDTKVKEMIEESCDEVANIYPSLTGEDKEISEALDRELGFEVVSHVNDMKETLSESPKVISEDKTDEKEQSEPGNFDG